MINKISLKKIIPKSISMRISLSLFFITLLIFFIITLIILNRNYSAFIKFFDINLFNMLERVVAETEIEENGSLEFDYYDLDMADFSSEKHNSYCLIITVKDKKEIYRSYALQRYNLHIPDILDKKKIDEKFYWNDKIYNNNVRFIGLHKIIKPEYEDIKENRIPNNLNEECLIIIGKNLTEVKVKFNEITGLTIIVLSLGLIILLIIQWLVLFYNLKPLKNFKKEVKEISSSNLIPVSIPEVLELKNVAETLNDVIDKLKDAFIREQRFTSNVAHELRTPICEILTLVEVVLKYSENMSKDDYTNYSDILESIKYLQNIVNTLLIITRFDANALSTKNEIFSLKTTIINICNKYKNKSVNKKIIIINKINEPMKINYDKAMINTIFENLISNSIEYSPYNSKIKIASYSIDSISITNEVEYITQEDINLMFERFWRKDKARTSNNNHCGLGLSLVKSLVEFLELSINTELINSNMLKITISGFIVKK